jgi:ATP-dependent Zn protease
MLSNERLTPSTDAPLIQHEIESMIKMHIAGIVACRMKYNEHASNAKVDLDDAKELLKNMLNDYGMGSYLIPTEREEEEVMKRLYDETKVLLTTMSSIMKKVEIVLNEKESITKSDVKKYIDEIF